MGYLTRYTLTIEDIGTHSGDEIVGYMMSKWEVAETIKRHWDLETGLLDESIKWYDYHSDMEELSEKFPTAVFKLHGEGEESGDIWTNWYKNGKSHIWTPVIEEPDFDPTWFK